MKKYLPVLLLLAPFVSFCQDSASINKIVRDIDKLSETGSHSFTSEKTRRGKKYQEKWQYFDNKLFSRIIINYKIDSAAYSEEYYLKNGALIYAEENEIRFYPSVADENGIPWAGYFYFSKDKLIDHVTFGHGKSEMDDWDPEKRDPSAIEKRKAELAKLK